MKHDFPTAAQAVIIGGGVIGTSTAYHLAALGWTDVVVLERDKLTSGTTWHAAGLIASSGMSTETLSWIVRHSRDLYCQLEDETGVSTGFHQCGHLHIATTKTRREAQRREMNFMRLMGHDKHEISPSEVKAKFPLVETKDVLSAIWSPEDGRANPVDVTMAMAAGARKRGIRIIENCPVYDILVERGRVCGVITPQGTIQTDVVVLAAGMWSRQIGAKIGVSVPLQAMEHYYLLTEPMADVHRDMPIVEDPESYAYVREEGGGLLFGLFEPDGAPWMPNAVPEDASFSTLAPDWDRMTPHLEHAFRRFPAMQSAGLKSFFCGPESFTPDGKFLVGESPEVMGLYLGTGLNSLGILSGGGIGALLAEEIVHGNASQDMTGLTPACMARHTSVRHYLIDRLPDALSYIFTNASLPNWKHKRARGARRLPLHDRYAAKGAYFVPLSGWEMPNWFAQSGPMPKVTHEFGRQDWFHLSAAEHRATRESIGLFDKTFMGKFIVQGRDAEAVLNRVSASSVSVPVGTNIYTQWLNVQGGIISDLTITRLAEDEFLLVTGDVLERITPSWIKRHTRMNEFCCVTDVTSAYTILSLQGPRARDVLGAITGADLSTETLPFRGSCMVEIGYARIRIIRVTYMGELGYELYIPSEQSLNVYDALVEGIEAQGVAYAHCGLMALESLRLEKGYRDFGVDIDNTDTPLEMGLGFVVDMSKDFIGRDRLAAQKAAGPLPKRLVALKLEDPEPLLIGSEPLFADGVPVGYVRAGAFGHTLGTSIGLAIIEHPSGVTAEYLTSDRFTVTVNDKQVKATLSFAPFYDPKSERVRA
ncbi:MAG: GcvT family protein [Rhodobacteraceae bacterium]|nr:GcvT family protein [Paracoccaceae bacterium]